VSLKKNSHSDEGGEDLKSKLLITEYLSKKSNIVNAKILYHFFNAEDTRPTSLQEHWIGVSQLTYTMCSLEIFTALGGKENKELATEGGSGIKEDGAITIGVEDEQAAKSASAISPTTPSPESATAWGDSTSFPVVEAEGRWVRQAVKEEKEGIGKTEIEDKRERSLEGKVESRFKFREERLDDGLPPHPIDFMHLLLINPHRNISIQNTHSTVR
jgi:hypothetical protein